jgi:tRNA 2-thiouridine synthesizing protein E
MANIEDAFQAIRGASRVSDSRFPHAPADWTPETAVEIARQEQLALGDDHWAVVRGLQEFFARQEEGVINLRDLHDALDEKFHYKGGIKYLYTLLPGGPIAQGCRLAGLEPPAGAVDMGFGSVA